MKNNYSGNSPDWPGTFQNRNTSPLWERILILLTFIALLTAGTVQAQTTISVPTDYPTIQAAIAAAHDGDIINVANGTYIITSTLSFNKSITIKGQSEAGVIIDVTGVPAGSWGINPNKSNTTLSYLTILPRGTDGGFPIHVGDNMVPVVISNVTLSHITINGAKKSAFDFNGVDNLTLDYLTAKNTASGVGVAISGCTNVSVKNISTANNSWGGLAVYVSRTAPNGVGRGSDNVTIDGTTTNFTEINKIYVQDEYGFNNTNVKVLGFDYIIQNPTGVSGYTFYQSDKASALAYAAALNTPESSFVKQISNGEYWVSPSLKIQTAINAASNGATINVVNGTYIITSTLSFNKSITIKGESEAGVIIDVSGIPSGAWGLNPNKSNTTLSSMTIRPRGTDGGFPIHVGDNMVPVVISNVTLNHITIDGAKKTAFDFNGVDHLTLSYLTAKNTTSGNGIQVSGCTDVHADHITTSGNSWGGFAVFVSRTAPNGVGRGSDQINIDGTTSSFGESNKVYDQNEFGYSNTNITITGFDYMIQNSSVLGYTFYQIDRPTAFTFAATLSTPANSVVKQISTGEYCVNTNTSIQNLINTVPSGSTVNLTNGTYNAFTVNQPMTISGASGVKINHGSPAITVAATGVTIIGITFDYPETDYAIDVLAGAFNVTIRNCSFLTTNGVRNQGTGTVDATQNWWNSISGPNSGGSSATTSGTVLYNPWKIPVLQLSGPANTVSGVSILPYFEWVWPYAGNNIHYELNIYDSNSTTLLTTVPNITDIHYQMKETDFVLQNNHTYYWTVSVYSGAIPIGNPSAKSSFKTSLSAVATLSTPSNGATVYVYSPILFTWTLNQQVGNLTFGVQYMKNSSLTVGHTSPDASDWAKGTLVTTVPAGSEITLNTETLDSGTKYWWRVITYSNSKVVSYSSSKYFTTSGGATVAKAIPSWPTAGNKVYTNNPTCYWYTNSGDLTDISFDLVVSSTSSFSGGQLFTYHTTNMYADVTNDLTPGATYYWKVLTYYKYVDAEHYGALNTPTTYATFKANGVGTVMTPVLSYPTGGVTVYTESPTLYWYVGGSSEGLTYAVTVNGHSFTTTDLFFDLSTVSAGLKGGSTYIWTVTASGAGGTSSTVSGSFKIAGGIAQGKPIASWPVGNPTVYETSPTLYWYVSGSSLGLDKYTVAWTAINPATTGFSWESSNDVERRNITDLTQTYYTLDKTLDYGKKYYWAIASHNSAGYSNWSSSSFTLVGTVGSIVPVIAYPKGGVTISSTSASLSWFVNGSTTGIQGYKVIYSTRADMNESDGINTTIVGTPGNLITDQFLSISNLVPGATYYWKVASFNGAEYAYSTTGVFSVASSADAAIVPMIGGPNNGVPLQTDSPMLTWLLPTMAKAPLTYELQYSIEQDLSSPVTVSGIKDPSKIISGLKSNQVYYWRVRSMTDKGQYSAYSEPGKFVVNSVTAVDKNNEIPTQFALDQNYPNPFNPSTVIQFGLPNEAFVTLKIYNVLGQEVKTLMSAYKSAGTYNVQWNGEDNSGSKVQSGTYIYRIVAGDYVSAKKMIMLK